MARQTTAQRKAKAEAAKAEGFINKALAEANEAVANGTATPAPQRKRMTEADYAAAGITADAIKAARDAQGLSWRDVAKVVGLPNPGAARKAYEVLTGVPHSASVMTGKRAPRGSVARAGVLRPEWGDDTDDTDITEAIEGHTITVRMPYGAAPLELDVYRVDWIITETPGGKPCPKAVEFIEGRANRQGGIDREKSTGAVRTVRVDAIQEVR